MKHLCLALAAVATLLGPVRAQERRGAPPTEIPDFSNLDEFVRIPTSTVTFGFRFLSGVKTSFAGQGQIAGIDQSGPATGANLPRIYHDGRVLPDARTAVRRDAGGNPIIDPDSGNQVFEPIAPDGRTNTWSYTDAGQLTDDGFLALHQYSAEIIDPVARRENTAASAGMELVALRDMGRLLGTRMTWQLNAGMSINDIYANTTDTVQARLTTLTDFYSLYGQTPPEAPYNAPSTTTENVLDAGGSPVLNEDGTNQTVTTNTTVLLGNEPLGRTVETLINETSVNNRWRLKGAYFTFRAGPTVWVPLSTRLKFGFSVGATLIYAGSNYSVTQMLQPDFGTELTDTSTDSTYELLPGYYADASLQYDITERAGFFAGAIYQSAGSYTQEIETATAKYATDIDFANQSGLRAGMSIRF